MAAEAMAKARTSADQANRQYLRPFAAVEIRTTGFLAAFGRGEGQRRHLSALLRRPFLVTNLVPGQEEPDLGFVEAHNLGWAELGPEGPVRRIEALACDPTLLREQTASISRYRDWNARAIAALPALVARFLGR